MIERWNKLNGVWKCPFYCAWVNNVLFLLFLFKTNPIHLNDTRHLLCVPADPYIMGTPSGMITPFRVRSHVARLVFQYSLFIDEVHSTGVRLLDVNVRAQQQQQQHDTGVEL